MSTLWQDAVFGPVALELYRRYGLVFEGGQAHLFRKRLERRAVDLGHPDVSAYLASLRGGSPDPEFERLVDLLTVNETYFFREEEHFQTLIGELWPEWTKAGDNPIRIWSAGCSTGCEALTLLMMLKEKGLLAPGRPRVEVIATDVNSRVIEEARAGVFGEFSLRNTSAYYRNKYFVKKGHQYQIQPELRDAVGYRRFNLLVPDPSVALGRFHAVFCRNVLIYFDAQAKRRTVDMLARSLRPGGVLIVGRSESLFNVPDAPPLANIGGVLVHRKA